MTVNDEGFRPATSVKQPPWCYLSTGPHVVLTAFPSTVPRVVEGDDLADVLVAAAEVGTGTGCRRLVVVDTHGVVIYARDFGSGEFVGTRQVADTLLGMASCDGVSLTLMDTFERCRQWVEAGGVS